MEPVTFLPRRELKCIQRCAVRNCKNTSRENVGFHCLPRAGERFVYVKNVFRQLEKIDRLAAWKDALKLNKIRSTTKICSQHFHKDDYILPDIVGKRRYLKNIAVPSCNLPGKSNNTVANVNRHQIEMESTTQRMQQQNAELQPEIKIEIDIDNIAAEQDPLGITEENLTLNCAPVMEETESKIEQSAASIVQTNFLPNFGHILINNSTTQPSIKQDVGVQVNSDYILSTVVNFIKTEVQLNTATGIPSFKVLNLIVNLAKVGLANKPSNNNIKMNLRDKVILTYVKLKHNLSYSFLAILFNTYSAKHCQRVYSDMIELLSQCMKGSMKPTTKEDIVKNIPKHLEDANLSRII